MIRSDSLSDDVPAPGGSARFLVDRVWPRGVKGALALDGWLKDVAPCDQLRRWFGHDLREVGGVSAPVLCRARRAAETCQPIQLAARQRDVTLPYGVRNTEHNDAVALSEYLQAHAPGK